MIVKVTENNYVFYNKKEEYLKKYLPKSSIALLLIEDTIKVLLNNDILFYDKILKEGFTDLNLALLIDKLRIVLGVKDSIVQEEISIHNSLEDSNKLALELNLAFDFTEENINSKFKNKLLELANKSLLLVKEDCNSFLKKELFNLKINSIGKFKWTCEIEGLGEKELNSWYRSSVRDSLKNKSLINSTILYDTNSLHSIIFIKSIKFIIDEHSYFTISTPILYSDIKEDEYQKRGFSFWTPLIKISNQFELYENESIGTYNSLTKIINYSWFRIPKLYLYSISNTNFLQNLTLYLNGEIIKDFSENNIEEELKNIFKDKLNTYLYEVKDYLEEIFKLKELEEKTKTLNKNYTILLKLNNIKDSNLDKKTQKNLESIKKVLDYKKIIDSYIEKINDVSKEII